MLPCLLAYWFVAHVIQLHCKVPLALSDTVCYAICIVSCMQVRELFASAAAAAPCIVFIDEVDAITAKRETRYTLSLLLLEHCFLCLQLQ
jgi:AAA+ superfamily predicted ATPase